MRIAVQEKQEEMLTSLKPTRRAKHTTKKAPTPSTAETTGITSSERPTHSPSPQADKPTEKVSFPLFFIYTLFHLSLID